MRSLSFHAGSLDAALYAVKLRMMPFHLINLKSKPADDPSLIDLYSQTGFCFIHIPKNGGSSVEKILYGEAHVRHRKWMEVLALSPDGYETWQKFCVVRDPVDRFLSAFDYMKKGGRNQIDAEVARRYVKPFEDINEFIARFNNITFRKKIMAYFHFQQQADYVLSDDGVCMVNHLLPFERFDEALACFLAIAPSKIQHRNKTQGTRTGMQDIDADSLDIIKRYYRRDFLLHAAAQRSDVDLYQAPIVPY